MSHPALSNYWRRTKNRRSPPLLWLQLPNIIEPDHIKGQNCCFKQSMYSILYPTLNFCHHSLTLTERTCTQNCWYPMYSKHLNSRTVDYDYISVSLPFRYRDRMCQGRRDVHDYSDQRARRGTSRCESLNKRITLKIDDKKKARDFNENMSQSEFAYNSLSVALQLSLMAWHCEGRSEFF